jgi:hypothetical protein
MLLAVEYSQDGMSVSSSTLYMSHSVDERIHNRVNTIKFVLKNNKPNLLARPITKTKIYE